MERDIKISSADGMSSWVVIRFEASLLAPLIPSYQSDICTLPHEGTTRGSFGHISATWQDLQ